MNCSTNTKESGKEPLIYDAFGEMVSGKNLTSEERRAIALKDFWQFYSIENDTDEIIFHMNNIISEDFGYEKIRCYNRINLSKLNGNSRIYSNNTIDKNLLVGDVIPVCSAYSGFLSNEMIDKLKDFITISKAYIEYLNDPSFNNINDSKQSDYHANNEVKSNEVKSFDYGLLFIGLKETNDQIVYGRYAKENSERLYGSPSKSSFFYSKLVIRKPEEYYERLKDAMYLWDPSLNYSNLLNWYEIVEIYYQNLWEYEMFKTRMDYLTRKEKVLKNND
ncbi:MAG: hypothetical protein HQ541_14615 [Mariniphaga sp.]|nr:hypothetical protein [Mariniphaga sp.]